MRLSLSRAALIDYVQAQLTSFFPDRAPVGPIAPYLDETLDRVDRCFSRVNNRYFRTPEGDSSFSHLHSDQYAMFLYFLSNTMYRNSGPVDVCSKTFLLNKLLNGIDVYYEVALPDIFCFCHPLGTVLGRARYGNYFLVYQGCTIGARSESPSGSNTYPELGEHVAVYRGASVLGGSRVGDHSRIAAGALMIDQVLPPHSLYRGVPEAPRVTENRHDDRIWHTP